MGDVRLVAPRVLVIFANGREPLEVQTDNRDMVGYEKTRLRRKPPWPPFNEGPFQWLTFLSWSAARRAGEESGTYEAWEESVLSVRDMSSMDDDGELGSPTPPGPEPG